MKKRFFIYALVLPAFLVSCRKDKTIFSQSPDQRINQVLTAYQDSLVNSRYGWRGFIFPKALNGGVVSFYFAFNNTNRVQMFSDFDSTSAVTKLESSYGLKALQQPVLIFDTYCYVSVLADPDGSVNGGTYGNGLGSDFQFSIDTVTADTIKLTGSQHNTRAYLVKAAKQDSIDFYSQQYSNRNFDKWPEYLTYFKRLTVGATTYEVQVNHATRMVTITWIDGNGGTHKMVTGYYYTATGVRFTVPIVDGCETLTGFDNVTWNALTLTSTVSVNGTVYPVNGAARPLSPDAGEPNRWWGYPQALGNAGGWASVKGFHSNGVDDAFGVQAIGNYYYLAYQPQYQLTSGVYDLLFFYLVVNNQLTINYAPAFHPPTISSDGTTNFSILGLLGNIPSADSVAVMKSALQLGETNGYYFVQQDSTSYDMVGAKDGKTWISWFYH